MNTLASDQLLENPLWSFSLNAWQDMPLREALMALQEEIDADINQLVFLIWCAAEGLDPSTAWPDILATSVKWQARIKPIREKRLALKNIPEAETAYREAKSDELLAEQQEQAALYALKDSLSERGGAFEARLVANLQLALSPESAGDLAACCKKALLTP